ncbi:uncharacterized protein LOC128734510 [Sabethes cyaneus]|uniref:uncharacterized protein LOC128734510 n=1 Tax=Sabethes cyaneus TaxID=53552 RepID=UPI00237D3A78|nr:uncharacterized protein LOC128734510 [Sabethes cyaneus]
MVRLVVLLLCISMTTTQKPGNFNLKEKAGFRANQSSDVDPQVLEIHRQNLITQKILQRYLERRLHPERKPQIRVPSVDEILARSLTANSIRDTRQQSQNSTGTYKTGSAANRYNLFIDYGSEPGDEARRQQQQQQNDDEDYEIEQDLDQYDDLGGSLDNDHIDIDSLQSGESEHVDSFYRDRFYRHKASQISRHNTHSIYESTIDDDFDDAEEILASELTNEIPLLPEMNQQEDTDPNSLADLIQPTKVREKRQVINSRTNRRSRTAQQQHHQQQQQPREQTITNRIDSRYYISDDYVDYTTTPKLTKNLRDNWAEYRILSKSKASGNDIRTSRPRTTASQSTLVRNAARSRNRNTLKSLAYKPTYNTRRPSFTLSAYGGNKPTVRGNARRGGNHRTYKDEEQRVVVNRYGHTTTNSDWRRKTVSMGTTSLQPSTPALTVTFYLTTDATVSLVTNSRTEISLIKTTTTSIEEICTTCFSLTQGPNGLPVHVLNKEITSFNNDGLFEITKFILSSTPTTTISVSQNTFRGRSTAYSATISTTIYEATPFVQTKGSNPNSAVLSNAPLANILLSQLLLGNLGVGEPNFAPRPTEFIPDPNRYQLVVTTNVEYKTHVKQVISTVTQTKSIVLPVTFQGREILTTVYDSEVTATVITSFVTETLTVPTTSTIRIQPTTDDLSNKLSLLLPLLEERERRNQLLSAAAAEPVLPIISTPPPTPTMLSSASVSKVYVSGQHPGEFSVSFTTILNT